MTDLKSVLDSAAVPQAVKANAWDAYQSSSSPQDFQAKFDALPLDKPTKAALWDLKFSQQKAPVQTLDPNQPGMQPAVNGLAPRDVSDKAEETVGRMVQHAQDTISAPFNAGVKLIHDLKAGTFGNDGPHNIEKYGVLKGTAKTVVDSFKNLNPVAPDTGQGPLNRVADTVGNVEGMGIAAEAVPTAEEAAAAKAKAGQAVNAAVDTLKTVTEAAKNAAKTVINSKPVNFFADIAPKAGEAVGKTAGGYLGAHLGTGGTIVGAEVGGGLGKAAGTVPAKILAKLRDTLNAHAADIPENAATSAESNFAEAGSREPEVVHAGDEDLGLATAYAAPAKVKAILDKAEADIKQVTAAKEQQPAAAPGSPEDKLDDRALSQEMGWDIAKHYYRGMAEQRDMAASSLSSKTELTTGAKVDSILAKAAEDARSVLQAAKIPSEGSKAAIAGRIPASWVKEGKIAVPQPGDDLVEVLQRSIDQVKARRGKSGVVKPTKGSVDGDSGAK